MCMSVFQIVWCRSVYSARYSRDSHCVTDFNIDKHFFYEMDAEETKKEKIVASLEMLLSEYMVCHRGIIQ